MIFNSAELLDKLTEDTRILIAAATELQGLAPGLLSTAPGPGCWSVVQVLDHLNHYGHYYLPALHKAFAARSAATTVVYRSGWLGDYFTKMMLPGAGGMVSNKMNAPKSSRPQAAPDVANTIAVFLEQQHALLALLELARHKDLGRIKVPVSLARWLRLRAGDTLRFVLAHEQRHWLQVQQTLARVSTL